MELKRGYRTLRDLLVDCYSSDVNADFFFLSEIWDSSISIEEIFLFIDDKILQLKESSLM